MNYSDDIIQMAKKLPPPKTPKTLIQIGISNITEGFTIMEQEGYIAIRLEEYMAEQLTVAQRCEVFSKAYHALDFLVDHYVSKELQFQISHAINQTLLKLATLETAIGDFS